MSIIKTIFTADYVHYEGVRPINIYLLRLLYFLMFAFVGFDSWKTIITHQGPWDHVRAVAWCVWAAYTTLSVLGLIHPLKMLPIVLFMIFYKTLWLIVVAYPLWRANALAGSPADEMAHVFIGAPFVALIVPWKYVFQNYVMWAKTK
ncbi:MAG: hypothetical protein ACREA9_29465 [Pyrinomonadaceae bacterium]